MEQTHVQKKWTDTDVLQMQNGLQTNLGTSLGGTVMDSNLAARLARAGDDPTAGLALAVGNIRSLVIEGPPPKSASSVPTPSLQAAKGVRQDHSA